LAGGVKSQKTRRESQKSQRITEYLSLEVDLMDGIGTHDPEEKPSEIRKLQPHTPHPYSQALASCNAPFPQTSTPYTIHSPTSQPSAEMNFFNLPLEARVMVYENVLRDEHHVFRDGVPGLLSTRLQITQEVYTLCKITTTVRSEVAPFFMNDLDDIKRRVDKFNSQKGNKGVIIRLLCRPELPSDFVTFMERAVLVNTMNVSATMVFTRGGGKINGEKFFEGFLGCKLMGPVTPPEQKKAFKYRWQTFYSLDTTVPDAVKNDVEEIYEGV
jgi:hypothetical protein